MDIQRQTFEGHFKTTAIHAREVQIRKKDILEFSSSFGYFNVVANDSWQMWQAAQKVSVPDGFVLVDKSHTEDWYLDPHEHMWFEQDGIDGWLSELDVGDVEAIEHKEYLITKNTPVFATKVWDDSSNNVRCWEFFNNKEEAEKAATYCKAKFNNDPNDVLSGWDEAQEQSHESKNT